MIPKSLAAWLKKKSTFVTFPLSPSVEVVIQERRGWHSFTWRNRDHLRDEPEIRLMQSLS